MGLIARLLTPDIQAASPNAADDFWYAPASQTSVSGVRVDADTALRSSTVFRCVSAVAQDIAAMPLNMYRHLERGKEKAPNHPLQEVLHATPNTWQTSFEWREMMMGHLLLRGNAYNLIVPGPRGFADQLIPLHPGRMLRVEQLPDRRLRYTYRWKDGRQEVFLQDEIFHIRGLSSDGITGLSVVGLARDSMGLGLATEQYGARYFSQDGTPGGHLVHPGKLSPEAAKRLAKDWQDTHSGLNKAHKVAVLEEGLKWTQVGMSNEDSQFLETRGFQVEEQARWFGVPLHRIGHTEKATSWGTGIAQFNQGYMMFTLLPWLVRWEQAITRDLILAPQTFFAKFTADAILRGDTKTRYEAHRIAIMTGFETRNEAREFEDRNPLEGLDEPLVPQNMASVDDDGNVQPLNAPASPVGALAARAGQMAEELAGIVIRREITSITKATMRFGSDLEGFKSWLNDFYLQHSTLVMKNLCVDANTAVSYAQRQMDEILTEGAGVVQTWEETVTPELIALALGEGDVQNDE